MRPTVSGSRVKQTDVKKQTGQTHIIWVTRTVVILELNSILWDRDMTTKTKTHIYHAIVKSTITYAVETWCLKAKKVAKLSSTEMDFWRRSPRISRKDKIRNNIMKQKMNVTKSLLEDITTKQLKWNGHIHRMEESRLSKKVMK